MLLDSLRASGFSTACWSHRSTNLEPLASDEIVVVDTIGHLELFYGAADVAFVGGSLVPHGGQNMLEPAALGRAVVFGPFTANFRTDVELLLGAEAALQVSGVEELDEVFEQLLRNPGFRQELGARAVRLIRENQGATRRTLEVLTPTLLEDSRETREVASGVSEEQREHRDRHNSQWS
jgi:3-deoxy-D-manno-octulosonic-acid transferase